MFLIRVGEAGGLRLVLDWPESWLCDFTALTKIPCNISGILETLFLQPDSVSDQQLKRLHDAATFT